MSAEDESPNSWHDMYEDAVTIASTPSKSNGGPGGAGHSAQRTPERPPPSVRVNVVNDVSVLFMKSVPGVEVCGGKIGTSMKFCTAPVSGEEGCQYASHTTKASIATPAYFIRAGKGHSAYCEPCLPVPADGFPGSVVAALRGLRSAADWTKLFPTLAAAVSLPIDQQNDLIARGERNVAMGPTPAKRAMWTYESDDDQSGLKIGTDPDDPDESRTLTQFYKEAQLPEGDIKVQLRHMAAHWNDVVLSTEIYRTKIKDSELAARLSVEEIDDKVVQVASMMGEKPEGDLPLTAWSAIAAVTEGSAESKKELNAKVDHLVDRVTNLHYVMDNQVGPTVKLLSNAVKKLQIAPTVFSAESASDRETSLTRELNDLAKAHRELTEKHQQSLTDMATMNTDMKDMKSAIDELRRARVQVSPFDQLEYRRSMDDMRNQIHMIRRHVDENSTPSAGGSGRGHDALTMEEFAILRDTVATLSLEVNNMKFEMVSDAISFGGHHFMAPDSYLLFVTQHCPKGQLQFMLDFVSFMECAMNRNKTTTEQLKSMKAITGAGFKDQGTNYVTVYASFGTLIPAMFGTEHDTVDPSKKMGSMKDMKEWDPMSDRHGRKNKINTAVIALRRSMELQIVSAFGQASVASFFFKTMLQSTCSFWDALSSWITRFENEMVSQMNADASPALKASIWNLICWMVHSMFTELEVCRAPGVVAHDLEHSKSAEIAAAILEGALKAHKFMKELMDAQFNRHPIFAATHAEYLMTSKATLVQVLEQGKLIKDTAAGLRALQSEKDKDKGKGGKQRAGEN